MFPLVSAASAQLVHATFAVRGDAVSLNPQPLPPVEIAARPHSHRGDEVALNPQPLPPRWLGLLIHAALHDAVALNPQPLPPKA